MTDFNAAVKVGVNYLALYFTMSETENSGRHFTNVAEIKDTTSLISYFEDSRHCPVPEQKETLRRMFSRVAENPVEQSKFNGISSVEEAIEVLKKEPDDTYFVTPSNGGFIKLEEDDKAYDKAGRKIWPQKTPPSKGFFLRP